MWALRPASNVIKNRVLSLGFFPLCHMRSETAVSRFDERNVTLGPSHSVFDICLSFNKLYHSESRISCSSVWKNTFCSEAADTRSIKEDLDDGFSEIGNTENVNDLISKAEHSEDGRNLNSSSRTNIKFSNSALNSELFKIVAYTRLALLERALDKWIENGRCCESEEIVLVINALRKREKYGKALKLCEWLEKNKMHDLKDESDYAARVGLIAKAKGIGLAEKYMESIPDSLRGEKVYETLMANCITLGAHEKKVEEVFNKMRALKLPISGFTYDQMLVAYKRSNKEEKISNVLRLMEENNQKPTVRTYTVLIGAKARTNDSAGIETILKKMKAEGIEPDMTLNSLLVRIYISNGDKEKAESILKELEGGGTMKRPFIRSLIPLYASLGNADAVHRLCNLCEPNTMHDEHLAAIVAWGMLHNIEMAEASFKRAVDVDKSNRVSLKLCHAMLRVFVEHKELEKAKDLVKQMKAKGCPITSYCWESIGELFLKSGDLGKAEMALRNACGTPQFGKTRRVSYYVDIMEHYAGRGDVRNCERIFKWLKQGGNPIGYAHFRVLIKAYTNAKTPAYGLMERIKAEDLEPRGFLLKQLHQADMLCNTQEMDLLD